MKIIFLDFDDIKNPLLGAGQAKATYEVGSLLAKRGHVVEVICSKYPQYEDRIDNGISYKHIGLGSKNIRLNNAAYILSIPLYVSFLKADIIIECFTAPVSTLCSQLFTKIPVVGLPTSFEAERFSKLYKFPFDRIQNWGLKTYKYFLPYTKFFDQKMKALNPKIISKIVPEGVGDEFFTYPRKTPKYILFIGRYDMGQKGIDLLIKAYAKIANEIAYPLVLAGHGPDEMRIRSLIGRLKLKDKITVQGSAFGTVKKKLWRLFCSISVKT
jgi:glycosyltransferase involved in cell wall biosynthesis